MTYIENTRWGYQNTEGHRLHVSTVGVDRDHVELAIAGIGDLDWRSLNIPVNEAPGIALAVLLAAGFKPSGRTDASTWQESVATAAGYLDDAVLLAAGETIRERLAHRRDELAISLGASTRGYDDTFDSTKRAIDMIIKMQDEATK